MTKNSNLKLCIFTLLLATASCSKSKIGETGTAPNAVNHKLAAKTSSVTGYWKDNTTSVTWIDCNPGYTKVVLYSIGPISVAAGDVISAHFQQQFGQTGNPPIMAASGLIVGTSATDVAGTGMIAGWAGSNLSQQEGGREVIARTGSYKFATAASNIYINAVAYGQALITGGGSGDLTIPAGTYGELVAVLESGVTWYKTKASSLPFNSTEGKNYVPWSPVLNVHNTIGPVTVPTNSMVDVRFDIEATSQVPTGNYNQRLGRNIIQTTSATSTSGTFLTKQIQGGIIKGEHHYTVSHVGGMPYVNGLTNGYFNSILYSYGNWTGENLYIEPGTTSSYGQMIVEVRPNAGFYEDTSNNFSTVTATPQVLYSVGPIDLAPDQVAEVRYQASFAPSAALTIDSKIVRATSPTATTGVNVQQVLARGFHPYYVNNNMVQSTADKNGSTAVTGQYYNVVVFKINGTDCPVNTWGELEVVKR